MFEIGYFIKLGLAYIGAATIGLVTDPVFYIGVVVGVIVGIGGLWIAAEVLYR
ncbi:hypothetical protein LCGC14_2315810 [marine sediment metagenome]|uniref:Uncharacterized protein n=1 Tax=marine sediment metagenome TaxID=412755 RepID=A0A0F9D6T5_9ZZZZ